MVKQNEVSRRSFLGLLAAAAAFLLTRLPGRRTSGASAEARFWRRLGESER